jgi:NitT/TauT family transport system substrate-binding protein
MNKSHFKKLAATCAGGAIVATMLIGANASPALAAYDIKIGLVPINAAGAVQYAIDSGMFRKNGINVTEVVPFPAPPPSIAALAAGAVQFTYAPSIAIINAYANAGMALKVVAPADGYDLPTLTKAKTNATIASQLDDTGVCVSKTSGINTWKDLEGKTISVPARKTQGEVTIANAVKNAGGNPATINWVTLGFPQVVDSVASGKVAGGFTVEPFTTACSTAGLKNLGAPGVAFFTNESAIGMWVTTAAYASANPAAVLAFQKSIAEANAFAMASKANMTKVLTASTKITGSTLAQALAANPPYYPATVVKIDIQNPASKMLSMGYLTKPLDTAGLLYTQYRK